MSSDEEFNPDQENLAENDAEEWEDVLGPEEQICSELSALDISNTLGSTVWLYFDKNPLYALAIMSAKNVHTDIKQQ